MTTHPLSIGFYRDDGHFEILAILDNPGQHMNEASLIHMAAAIASMLTACTHIKHLVVLDKQDRPEAASVQSQGFKDPPAPLNPECLEFELISEEGSCRTVRHTLPIDIGRAPQNTLRVPHWRVAKHHARIFRQGNAIILQDLGSLGGTVVNGVRTPYPDANPSAQPHARGSGLPSFPKSTCPCSPSRVFRGISSAASRPAVFHGSLDCLRRGQGLEAIRQSRRRHSRSSHAIQPQPPTPTRHDPG